LSVTNFIDTIYESEMTTEVETTPTEKMQIRILVADDHPLLRQALAHLLKKYADLVIIAEAADGEEAVCLATELKPDVIIMDIGMPKLNGLEATRQIKAILPSIAILVLTVHSDPEDILSILEAGAAGYLMKDVFGDEVVNAIRSVVTGGSCLFRADFQTTTQVYQQISY